MDEFFLFVCFVPARIVSLERIPRNTAERGKSGPAAWSPGLASSLRVAIKGRAHTEDTRIIDALASFIFPPVLLKVALEDVTVNRGYPHLGVAARWTSFSLPQRTKNRLAARV